MERIALHTRLKPGMEQEYESLHAEIPSDLDGALREAGVRSWEIWRDGLDLFHVVEVLNYGRMRAFLREHPANVPWQKKMAALLEVEDDYSGNDRGLPLVWELP
ncbi:L-rhamnose mutarotase [Actinoplanes sp. CA-030573]|uniref:L-rhamnose mutarotase n=1 Tax=Actinoplanes sp. CA-030573 TaxID=3239898 RepID=UPI003D8C2EED